MGRSRKGGQKDQRCRCVAQLMESWLPLQGRVVWEASFHCGRCRGLMYRIELWDWEGESRTGRSQCAAMYCLWRHHRPGDDEASATCQATAYVSSKDS